MFFGKVNRYYEMLKVNQYKNVLLDNFYLDTDNKTVRYKNDGYYNRYSKGDEVKSFKYHKLGILGVHIPKTRQTIPLAHLVLLLKGVEIPDDMVVDHVDGDVKNNHVNNLRVVSQEVNCRNQVRNKVSNTGHNGIRLSKYGTYVVRITVNKTRLYLGTTKTLSEAIKLRDEYHTLRKKDGYTDRHYK